MDKSQLLDLIDKLAAEIEEVTMGANQRIAFLNGKLAMAKDMLAAFPAEEPAAELPAEV